MSRIDFAPEHVTRTGDETSATRSADTSGGVGYPRCTPPMPPVPMNRMPTIRATASTPPTVVAPTSPATAHAARSRGPSFLASESKRSSSSSPRPTRTRPSRTPIVAGVAPASRTARSMASPTSTPCGAGNPCATMVVSSATTARRSSSAARTSSESRMSSFTQRTLSASHRSAGRSARLLRGRRQGRRRSSRPPARRPRPSCREPRRREAQVARRRRTSSRAHRA